MFWPAYVVAWGLLVGWLAAFLSKTPNKKVAMAACAFGNSTGLPITLLTVVHQNFPTTTELGSVDPTLFLSVYLLLYPMLQWSVGGYLLAPEESETEQQTQAADTMDIATPQMNPPPDALPNVLNNDVMQYKYQKRRRGLSETDASLYISEIDLVGFHAKAQAAEEEAALLATRVVQDTIVEETVAEEEEARDDRQAPPLRASSMPIETTLPILAAEDTALLLDKEELDIANGFNDNTNHYIRHFHSFKETLSKIVKRCLQPPVVGAMLGLFVAATPLRGVFVDIIDRGSHAPLQWFFDALYAVGQAAVPLNMIILGCNLSQSHLNESKSQFLSKKTMISIVVGKMLIMPIIGICSALLFNAYVWDIPEAINASFYLVVMIVFITPTANNVMIMVELSGSGAKEGIAQTIAWEYAVSPIILSLTMTTAVGIASQWS